MSARGNTMGEIHGSQDWGSIEEAHDDLYLGEHQAGHAGSRGPDWFTSSEA